MLDDNFEILKYLVEDNCNIIISGFAGSGKSYLLHQLYNYLKEKDTFCAITATTGIAAINVNGMTLHSWTGILLGQGTKEKLFASVNRKKKIRKRWEQVQILIIDEISMLGCTVFEKLDFIAKKIRKNDKPFGGIQLIVSGDFLQLNPINDNFPFMCNEWNDLNFVPLVLKTPYRFDDEKFYKILSEIRVGFLSNENEKLFKERVESYNELFKKNISELDIKPTILYSYRKSTESYNMDELNKLIYPEIVYEAQDNIVRKHADANDIASIANLGLKLDSRLPKIITLKIGAQVMLKTNLDIENQLVNGSRAVIIDTHSDYVIAKFLNGIERRIKLTEWSVENDDFIVTRIQIPFILAWATTIHSSQGLTLDYVICDLGNSIFSPGQAYVALSRVKNLNALFLSDFCPKSIFADNKALEYDKELSENCVEII